MSRRVTALTARSHRLGAEVDARVERARATWSAARTPPAGGRASCAPTSRWTPRTCCCGSSSASCDPDDLAAGRALDPFAAARRRHLGQLRRRPRRPVHHHRGLRRAAAGRRRPRRAAPAAGARVRPRRAAASRPAGSSPGSGWRCSASGRGTTCRPCRRSWCCCPSGCRSTSTTGPAGRGRPSCRSPSSRRCARSARCRSALDRAAHRRIRRPADAGPRRSARPRSACSTAC